MGKMKTMGILCAVLLVMAGCARLPLDNSAPAAPVLSIGTVTPDSVEILVTVDDPDGDLMTLYFAVDNSNGLQESRWTNFLESGQQLAILLNLSPGQWTLTALAKDELADESPVARLELTVGNP